jgi:hypothetical protein
MNGLFNTTQLSSTTEVIFKRGNSKIDFAMYPANVQISCSDLNGGTFDVYILPLGETSFKSHILGATEEDTVMIAGKDAPIFTQVKVSFVDNGGLESVATLTAWERGL